MGRRREQEDVGRSHRPDPTAHPIFVAIDDDGHLGDVAAHLDVQVPLVLVVRSQVRRRGRSERGNRTLARRHTQRQGDDDRDRRRHRPSIETHHRTTLLANASAADADTDMSPTAPSAPSTTPNQSTRPPRSSTSAAEISRDAPCPRGLRRASTGSRPYVAFASAPSR